MRFTWSTSNSSQSVEVIQTLCIHRDNSPYLPLLRLPTEALTLTCTSPACPVNPIQLLGEREWEFNCRASSTHSMRRNSTALYAGISWLKQRNNWNSFLILSGYEPDMQSHTQHIEDKHKEKQVCNSITSTTHTIQTQPWNWIKISLLLIQSVHGCSSQVLCLLLSSECKNDPG